MSHKPAGGAWMVRSDSQGEIACAGINSLEIRRRERLVQERGIVARYIVWRSAYAARRPCNFDTQQNEINVSTTFVDTVPFPGSALGNYGLDAAQPKPKSDTEVRANYNEAVSNAYREFIKEAAVFHDADQCFGEDLARKANDTRNALKAQHQAETSALGMVVVWARNLFKYAGGSATYEHLAKTKNPEEIAYSAFKTGGGDLGLANNGFGDVLNTWNAIKGVSTLYPEDITPAMVEAFKSQPAGKVDPAVILAARTDAALSNDVSSAEPPAQPLTQADVEMILAARPEGPEVLSKDELMSSLMQQGPSRRFAAYI